MEQMATSNFFDRSYDKPGSVLHHCNLEPRNILVDRQGDEKTWISTGILNWDNVLSVPSVITGIPPVSLWRLSNDMSSWDDQADLPTPNQDITEKGHALKLHFDRKMEKRLPGYNEDAYDTG
ncbi:hypothetical protein RUND412_005720, partial [Rhizina undulata]